MVILNLFKRGISKPSRTAEQRKKETEKFLASRHIPFIAHLPLVEEEAEATIRTPQAIAERIIILAYLGYVAEVPERRHEVIQFLKDNRLWKVVTANERRLFEQAKLNEQERINISWKTEASWVLLWCIGKVNKLALPIEQVKVRKLLSKLKR